MRRNGTTLKSKGLLGLSLGLALCGIVGVPLCCGLSLTDIGYTNEKPIADKQAYTKPAKNILVTHVQ